MSRLLAAIVCCALAGCDRKPALDVAGGHRVVFTRLGLALAEPIERASLAGRELRISPLAPGYVLAETPWTPEEKLRLTLRANGRDETLDLVAPPSPSPIPARILDLEPILPLPPGPDRESHISICRFAPDGASLLLATHAGRLARLRLPEGDTVFSRRASDGMIKLAAWSGDGRTLFVGEQTRDGFLYALDADTGAERWRYRLADDLGAGPPPDPDNAYLWVNHPGPYRMAVLPDGDLVVAAERSGTHDGARRSAARIYRFDSATGKPRWAWPDERAGRTIPLNIPWFDFDAAGRVLTFLTAAPMGTTAVGGGPVPAGSAAQLDLATGALLHVFTVPSLPPPFAEVNFWRSVAVSPDGAHAALATQDGREYLLDGADLHATTPLALAAPIEVSGLPVLATSGTTAATRDEALFVLGDTYIPYAAVHGEQRPASAHPAANSLYGIGWDGAFRWRRELANFPTGIALDAARRWAVVPFSPGSSGLGGDRNGAAVFDLARSGSGADRLAWEYLTAGAIPYDQFDISPDGRWIALVEVPYARTGAAETRGAFRLHLVH